MSLYNGSARGVRVVDLCFLGCLDACVRPRAEGDVVCGAWFCRGRSYVSNQRRFGVSVVGIVGYRGIQLGTFDTIAGPLDSSSFMRG